MIMGPFTRRKPHNRRKKRWKKHLRKFQLDLKLKQHQCQLQNQLQLGNHLSYPKRKCKPSLLLHRNQHPLKKLTIPK